MPISMRRDPGGHQATCHADPPTGPEPAQLPSSTTHRHPPPLSGRQTRPNPSPRRSRARCAGARAGCCGPNSRRATPVALRCTHRVCRQRTSSRHVGTEQVPDTQRRNRTGTRAEPVSSSDRAISPTPPGQQPSQEGPHNLSVTRLSPARTAARPRSRTGRAAASAASGPARVQDSHSREVAFGLQAYAQRPKWLTKTHSASVTHATTVPPAAPRRAPHQSRTKRPSVPGARHRLAGAHSQPPTAPSALARCAHAEVAPEDTRHGGAGEATSRVTTDGYLV
ncbi:Uncharacterised protein [Mycobacteroides abscessus subsp. massiliense]|nr:Uncharacterised protein [Mycobacteroides abscessus subsp. massiliense]